MTISLKAAADGLSGTIQVGGVDALKIDASTHIIEAIAPYKMKDDGPAFSAYQTQARVTAAAVWEKVRIDTEEYDTNSNFDSVTNYRFTATIAGYYQFNGAIQFGGNSDIGAAIYKNGVAYKVGQITAANTGRACNVSSLVYLGVGDYVEFFTYCGVTGTVTTGLSSTWFNGFLARAT